MAVVDVIDLTVSPPASDVIVIDDEKATDVAFYGGQDSKEKKKRKQRRRDERERDRRERRKQEKEDQRDNGSWKHDKYLEKDQHRQGEKRKRDEDTTRRPEGPLPPLFLIDTTAVSSSSGPSSKDPAPIKPVSVQPAVEPLPVPVESPDRPPLGEGLLLPAHVTVVSHDFVSLPNEDPGFSPNSEVSGIDFLDDDRAVVCTLHR